MKLNRCFGIAAVAMLLVGVATASSAQTISRLNIVETRPEPAKTETMLPLVVGAGAIAGVVAFNVLALGVEALPGGLAYAQGAAVPAEMSVAMSRVYATVSAVVGALIADYVYSQ